MTAIIITGILISRVLFPNLAVANQHTVRELHNFASYLTLVLVGIHIGIHWQWVMNIGEKMSKFEKGKPKKGFIVTGVVLILILIGGYQVSSTGGLLSQVVGVQGNHSQQFLFQKDGQRFDKKLDGGNQNGDFGLNPNQSENGSMANSFQRPPSRDFGDRGEFRDHGSQNALIAIIPILGLMGVFIFITYFGEKRVLRKKRKAL